MLEAYNIAHKYDIICISESYLDSAVPLDDTLSSEMAITLLAQTILMMLREEVFACPTRKTYPIGLSALLISINVYYVK